jgi:AraC family transcriptional regulator of adaptative response/methylated-DNA-[protein]-cysteine methyltransferase
MALSSYDTVAAAIRHLDAHADEQPSLAQLAAAVGLSEGHFQRVFADWAGVSPKRFLQVLTRERARALLRQSRPVVEAALAAGLSGGGRLHDLFVECEGVTPGEVASLGEGLLLDYGFAETPFGRALLASSARGLCHLRFVDGDDQAALDALHREWTAAQLRPDPSGVAVLADTVFGSLRGASARATPLRLWLKGTNFQVQVWQALLRVPAGSLVSYGELAAELGRGSAARAVGNAVGMNPVAWLIPCHRVIRETGALGGYRWGLDRKRTMLARELVAAGDAFA